MILKKYNCDKNQGEIEVRFSKQEVSKEGAVALCDYIKKEDGVYEVNVFLGLITYEELKPYRTIQFTCNNGDLKENLCNWWKSELEAGAAMKIVDFINNVVKPTYIKDVAEILKVYRVELSTNKIFEVEIYPDKTIYFDVGLFRTNVATYPERHNQNDIVRSISDLKNNEWI